MIERRNFLKGLFAAPAIVAVGSLMPIKAVKANIFTLEKFTEIPSYNTWCLVKESGGNLAWMMNSDIHRFINDVSIIEEVRMNDISGFGPSQRSKLTTDLMKIRNAMVVHELPSHFTRSLIL